MDFLGCCNRSPPACWVGSIRGEGRLDGLKGCTGLLRAFLGVLLIVRDPYQLEVMRSGELLLVMTRCNKQLESGHSVQQHRVRLECGRVFQSGFGDTSVIWVLRLISTWL